MNTRFFVKSSIFLLFAIATGEVFSAPTATTRLPQFSNEAVTVWKTIIYPNKAQSLKMHRHDHDRVVVALDDGLLRVTNDKREEHLLHLEKHKAYFLMKDIPNELHKDENLSNHPIRVMVIELNKT